MRFRVTSLKVRFGVTIVASPPCAMQAWELACRRVLLQHSSPQFPEWFSCEHSTCPRYILLTVVLALEANAPNPTRMFCVLYYQIFT